MDDYVNALCGDAPLKPRHMDEHLRWKGEDDYMRGVYNNSLRDDSYHYGFRMAHTSWQQYVQEVQAARQAFGGQMDSVTQCRDSNVIKFKLKLSGESA